MTELEQLKQQAQELTQRIEALENAGKAKGGVWLPKVGEKYFYQSPFTGVDDVIYDGDNSDIEAINAQRVYPTYKLAEANDHRKETIAVWNKFREMETEAVDWEEDEQEKFYIGYYHGYTNGWSIDELMSYQTIPETEWYTTSRQAAEWVIANMQTELKKIWRV